MVFDRAALVALIDERIAAAGVASRHKPEPVLVSLAEAQRHSGYTADYLGRLVRAGELRNYGRKHAPRVRLDELPRKARHRG